jgi:hypothetical protein
MIDCAGLPDDFHRLLEEVSAASSYEEASKQLKGYCFKDYSPEQRERAFALLNDALQEFSDRVRPRGAT